MKTVKPPLTHSMTTPLNRLDQLTRLLVWMLFALLCASAVWLHRDVPYHDQWDLLPLLVRSYQGQLTFSDLLMPHNGHVLLLPQALMLGLAWATHWNTLAEVICSWLLGGLNYVLLLRLFSANPPHRLPPALFRLPLGLLAFSLAQADNWLWGWQLQVPLCLSAVLTGTLALRVIASPAVALGVAALCALAASVSFAAGVVFWFAALPLVWQRGARWLGLWLLLTLLCLAAYVWLLSLAGKGTPSFPLDGISGWQSLHLLQNTLRCLGSLPARFHPVAALLTALLGLAALLWLLHHPATTGYRALLCSFALFGVGTALLIAVSRSSLGSEQMLASRYTTFMLPFWAAVLCPLLCLPGQARWSGVLLSLLITYTSATGMTDWQRLHNRLVKGELALTHPSSPDGLRALKGINPRQDPQQAQQEVALLAQYRLRFYRTHSPP